MRELGISDLPPLDAPEVLNESSGIATYYTRDQVIEHMCAAAEHVRTILAASAAPAEGRHVKAWLYQHKQSGKMTFVTTELRRDEFEGMNPEYAYVGPLVLATAPTMSEAALGARNKAVEQLRYFLKAKRFDRETFLDDSAFVDWVMSRSRALLAEIERIDRADAKRGSDGPAPD